MAKKILSQEAVSGNKPMKIYSIYSLDFNNCFKLIIRAASKKRARKAAKDFFHYNCFDDKLESIALSPRMSKCTYEGRAANKYNDGSHVFLLDHVLCAMVGEH